MKVDRAANKIRLADTAKQRGETRERLRDYLDRSGLHSEDFAQQIGYGGSSLRFFLEDQYHHIAGSDARIIQAINTFVDAHPIGGPRQVVGNLFETANVRMIRDTFEKLLPRPRAFMIYAPPGSQKSFVIEHEVAALNQRELSKNGQGRRAYYIYARQNLRPHDLMRRIAVACGSRSNGNIDRILSNLRLAFQGRRVLLAIDEAQHLSIECFEVVRELLDQEPYFSLLFAGSHDLYFKFDRESATLEQWNSRIARKVKLPGASREEALAIVEREVGDILRGAAGSRSTPDALAARLVDRATVVDAYVQVGHGKPKATYINIRTLCNSLDDLKSQHSETSKGTPA